MTAPSPYTAVMAAVAALSAATATAWLFRAAGLAETNLVLAYLLAVTYVAASWGRLPSIATSFAAVLLFNFFFTEPHYTLRVHDSQYLFTFGVMLVIAILVSTLTAHANERDRLSETARRAVARAEVEKLRSTLLSSVSHDFRTPLAAIAGASSSLLEAGEGLVEDERRELLQTIIEESARLTRLVDNLLHITRIESGQFPLRKEWNLVDDLVGSALACLAAPLAGRSVETRLPDDLPMLQVDGVLIEQVLINLLDNAAKYSPEGAPIDISAYLDGPWLVLEVADRGPGVAANDKARIFDKFSRGSRTGAGPMRGAGLGLAICQAVAVLHGGKVEVLDRDGGGSRFRMVLPVEEQPPAIDLEACEQVEA